MRTTLKRGIGRGAALNGNGRAVLPPLIAPAVTRYRQPPRTRRSIWLRLGRFFVWLLALALLVALGTAGGAYLYYNQSVAAVTAHSHDVKVAARHLALPLPGKPTTALVIGSDRRKGGPEDALTGRRSDTIMLLRADPTSDSISMLSFPRDLVTQIHCPGRPVYSDRINVAYGECGARGTLDTVRALTGLPINYLITVDFRGFRQIVDRVGGVWVDVDRRYFNRNVGTSATDYANIDLLPGYQKLSGENALSYVRFRHTDSDLYRIARQQQFVKALKEQVSKNFSVFTVLRILGAVTRSVEIGQAGGSGSLAKAIKSYALFAYGLPAGHFFQSRIEDLQGQNELYASQGAVNAAVRDFTNPDVEAPQKATDVALGVKRRATSAPVPEHTTVSVLNGNGVTGAASNAAYALSQRGYRIILPPTGKLRNAPSFDYVRTVVSYDSRRPAAKPAAEKIAALFGTADVQALPLELVALADRALVTVVVGQTFRGQLAPAPVDHTPKKQPPAVRVDPSQSVSLLRGVRKRLDFPLMVPTVVEQSSYLDREAPIRVYALKHNERAVRLTFLSNAEVAAYWGVEETAWDDAPALQQPNVQHVIGGRKFDFYLNGANVHMIVLREHGATYWVVNTLLDSLSNETMIAIAKGLKPLSR